MYVLRFFFYNNAIGSKHRLILDSFDWFRAENVDVNEKILAWLFFRVSSELFKYNISAAHYIAKECTLKVIIG